MSRLLTYDETMQAKFLLRVNGEDASDISYRISSVKIKEGSRKGLVLDVSISGLNPEHINFEDDLIDDRRLYKGAKWNVRWGYLQDLSGITQFIVNSMEPDFAESGALTIKVSLVGKDWYMGRESSACNWGRVNSSDIARQIATRHGFTSVIIEDSNDARASRAYIQPANVSDFEYLQQLGRRIGFVCYIDSNTFVYRTEDWDSSPHLELAWYSGDPNSRLLSFKPEVKEAKNGSTRANGDSKDGTQDTKDDAVDALGRRVTVDGHGNQNYVEGNRRAVTVDRERPTNTPQFARDEEGVCREVPTAEEEPPARRRIAAVKQTNALEGVNAATAKTLGTPKLRKDTNVLITGVGVKLSGVWHITDVDHDLGDDGKYNCTLKLKRGPHVKRRPAEVPNDACTEASRSVSVVAVDGQSQENYRTQVDPNSLNGLSNQAGARR